MPLPVGADAEKFAIIDCEKFMVTLQVSVTPGQFAPGALPVFQPAEAKPVPGLEKRVTTAPVAKVAEQVVGQLMPKGSLTTNPAVAGLRETLRVTGGAAEPDSGKVKLGFAGSLVAMVKVPVSVPATPAGGAKLIEISVDSCGGMVMVQGGVELGRHPNPNWKADGAAGEVTFKIKSSRPLF